MLTIFFHAGLVGFVWSLIWMAIWLPVARAEQQRNDPDRFRPKPKKAPARPLPWQQWLPATLLGVILLTYYIGYSANVGSIFGVVVWSCLLAAIVARFALKVAADRRLNRPAAAR
jgi:hypothetical protein